MLSHNKLTTYFAVMAIAGGCDIVQPDVKPKDIEATLYVLVGKPAVINLAAVTDGLDLKVDELGIPKFGTVQSLVGGKYVMYVPSADFNETEDMSFPLLDQSNKVFTNLKLKARSLDNTTGCSEASGVYDYATVKAGETIVIDLLDNDVFCGVGYNGGTIGQVPLVEWGPEDFNLSLGPGRQAKFTWTAPADFRGKLQVLYNLGINWKNPAQEPTYEEILANPKKYLEAFTTALIEVDVVE